MINDDKCATCGKEAHVQIVMNEWYWLRRGSVGHWFCSFPCVGAAEMKLNPYPYGAPPVTNDLDRD